MDVQFKCGYGCLVLLFLVTFLHADPVANARSHIGEPYKWGGGHGSYTNGSGIDCSGLVTQAYAEDGIDVSGTADSQSKMEGCPNVGGLESVQPGDTLYFKKPGASKVHHVVMVTGRNANGDIMIIEAPHSGAKVVEHPLSDRHDINDIVAIKRFGDCTKQKKEKDCTTMTYVQATGETPAAINNSRQSDKEFVFSDPLCVCNDEILNIFKRDTDYISSKVNPAVDNLVASGIFMCKVIDLTKKKIKNEKTINGLLSFKDIFHIPKLKFPPANNKYKGECAKGCNPIDLSSEDGKKQFLNAIDCFEQSGYDQKSKTSSAFGRYQFTDDTAREYAPKVEGCGGDAWKSSKECQDKMFILLTADNARTLKNKGVGINTCTLYMSHQQGVSGFLYTIGKSSHRPAGYKNNLAHNVGGKVSDHMNMSEEDLKRRFIKEWSDKMGGDITKSADIGLGMPAPGVEGSASSGIGKVQSLVEFMKEFLSILNIGKFYREGILLEQYHSTYEIKRVIKVIDANQKLMQIEKGK